MKRKILILSLILFTCLLFIGKTVDASEQYTDDVIVAEDGYEESYLTFHHEISSQITAETSYIDTKFSGETSIVLETKLGVTSRYAIAVVLADSTSTSQFTKTTYGKAVLLGSYKGGYLYYDAANGGEVSCVDIKDKYNDGISADTLFYSKTSFKLVISKNGNIDVYAKLTESLDVFLKDGGNAETHEKLSKEYIHLYTLESFYPASFIENGYYVGINVNMGKLPTNDIILHHVEVLDYDSEVLFADNFSHFELQGTEISNGYYSIPSNTVRQEYGKSIVLTKGEEYVVPRFDLNNIKRSVTVGETLDLTPELINLEGEYTITVKCEDEEISPVQGNEYKFEKQGIYNVLYSLGTVNRSIQIIAINKSTQPTVETNFSKEINPNRIDTNSSIVDGKLKLSDGGYFYTKGTSEGFILNLKFNSATEDAKLSIVLGRDGDNKYSLTLTETGLTYKDYFGNETLYECDNFIGKLISNEVVYVRVTLLGGILNFAAISENQSKELLNVNLVTISDILYVGQVGIEVEDGEVTTSIFQFVNLTDVKNDNTVTVAPEAPKPDEDEPSEEPENNKKGCGGSIAIGSIVLVACLVLFFVLRKKNLKNKVE